MPSSRGSSQPRDPTQVSCIAGGFFTICATREAQETLRQHKCIMLVLRMKQGHTGCLVEPFSHKTWLLPLPGVQRSYLLPPSSRSSSEALSCRKPSPQHAYLGETHHMLCCRHHALDQTAGLQICPHCRLRSYIFVFEHGSVGKESTCNSGDIGDLGSIPGLGRSPGGGNSNQLQYSCLRNPMDRGAWRAADQRVTKSRARLSDQV